MIKNKPNQYNKPANIAAGFLPNKTVIKVKQPEKRTVKIAELSEKDYDRALSRLSETAIYSDALIHNLKALEKLGIIKDFPLMLDFRRELQTVVDAFKLSIKDEKYNVDLYQEHLNSVEDIVHLLIQNDLSLTFRTKKFIESTINKKR